MAKPIESHPGISLKTHLMDVSDRIKDFCEDMGINPKASLYNTACFAGLVHDLGKATPYFQAHLKGERSNDRLASHALLSAVIAVHYLDDTLGMDIREKLSIFIAVRSHHSNPYNPTGMVYPKMDWETIQAQFQSINKDQLYELIKGLGLESHRDINALPSFRDFSRQFSFAATPYLRNNHDFSLYFTTNLLLGMLVDADIRAVIKMEANEDRKEIPPDIVDTYLGRFKRGFPIDDLRKDFYDTVIKNMLAHGPEQRFLSITAPTGIGKTLTGLSAAIKLREQVLKETGKQPRIIYVLPFTSIIDQNFEVIKDVLSKKGLEDIALKHHFRETIKESGLRVEDIWSSLEEKNLLNAKDMLKNYEKAHTRLETWDNEIIVTTFVRFYETLFTNRRSEMRRLHRLAGSIIILDEIQNIPACYWALTEEALKFLAEEWDTRFIIMTATRPALLPEAFELTEPKREFFFSQISRTKLHIEQEPSSYLDISEWLIPKIESARNFMVVLNTVRSAQQVYKGLKEMMNNFKIYFLSASLIPVHREKRIKEIKDALKNDQRIGLISTQVVEAGVDLDFDLVIRDLAPFDSVVQAAGRCNRNACSHTLAQVFLVELVDPENNDKPLATYIYDDGVLINGTMQLLRERDILQEKDYLRLVEDYFKRLRQEDLKAQDRSVSESIKLLNYDKISGFSLIKDRIMQVPVFVEADENAKGIILRLEELEKMSPKDYNERMARRKLFQSIEPELWGYIVNVPVKIIGQIGLGQLPYASSILWLPKEHYNFDEIYCEDTGFTRDLEHKAIFL